MCGILGIYSLNGEKITGDWIEKGRLGSNRMTHRGPDDHGEYVSRNGNCALFHRRLSIIDLSPAGHQPMSTLDSRYWITFNGEIYNYREVKQKLLSRGYTFQSSSDTEVILIGYAEWGKDILHHLRGIFAFSIIDNKEKSIFIARDRIGVKPLYYTIHQGILLFGSSLHALIKTLGQKPEMSHQKIYEYLYLGLVQAPHTIFEKYFKLPPGHYIYLDNQNNKPVPVEYWDVDHGINITIPDNEDSLTEELDALIVDAVNSRLVSDVPVSLFLSGGLDSGLVGSIASQHYKGQMKSFSLGFRDDDSFNELDAARETAAHFGTEHHEIKIGKQEVLNFFPRFMELQEEPSLNPIQMMIYFLSQLVHSTGTKVVLSGDGGDELFFGYTEWMAYLHFNNKYYEKYLKWPQWLRQSVYHTGKSFLPVKPRYDILRRAAYNETFYHGWGAFKLNELNNILDPSFKNDLESPYHTIQTLYEKFKSLDIEDKSYANWMRYVSLKTYLVEDYMSRVDNMAMAKSVEGRVPLLDQKLVERVFQLPASRILKNNEKKYLLKLVAKWHLPQNFITRPKRGFTAPLKTWLNDVYREQINSSSIDFNSSYSIFDKSFISNFQYNQAKSNINLSAYWAVLNLFFSYNKI